MKLVVDNTLAVNEVVLPKHILSDKQVGTVKLGQWEKEIVIRRTEENKIHVSEQFFPFDIPFELSFHTDEDGDLLRIGPVIAFLFSRRKKTFEQIDRYLPYMEHYLKVGGLVFISSLSQADFDNEKMSGYFYDPVNNEFNKVEKSFPFPDVIFRRCNFKNPKERQILWDKVQGNIFNVRSLNKYEQYQILSKQKQFTNFAETSRLDFLIGSIDNYLNNSSNFYIKPIAGGQGKGIVHIKKLNLGYQMKFKGETKFITKNELISFLKGLRMSRYIVQEGIKCADNRNIVFRIIMQKDDENKWVYTGGYARIGRIGSVITNRITTKKFQSTESALEEFYQAPHLMQEIIDTCRTASEGFDVSGVHFGDLAFDVMIDTDLKVWVIEINNRQHNHLSPLLTIKDRELYRKVVSTPLLYCKYLSKFPDNDNAISDDSN